MGFRMASPWLEEGANHPNPSSELCSPISDVGTRNLRVGWGGEKKENQRNALQLAFCSTSCPDYPNPYPHPD